MDCGLIISRLALIEGPLWMCKKLGEKLHMQVFVVEKIKALLAACYMFCVYKIFRLSE
jgi:hypothetical protein